jgi:hypothetical protein
VERAVRRWVGGLPLAVGGRRRPLTENTGARSDAALPKRSGRNSCFELRLQSSKNEINLPQSPPEMHSLNLGSVGTAVPGRHQKCRMMNPPELLLCFRIRVLGFTSSSHPCPVGLSSRTRIPILFSRRRRKHALVTHARQALDEIMTPTFDSGGYSFSVQAHDSLLIKKSFSVFVKTLSFRRSPPS